MTTVIVGPTAVGKSSLALAIARRFRAAGQAAEIINADSMQVYRGMDIGTAKPTADERAEVPHHLLDLLDITETATVAQFQRLARTAIASCRARAVVPLVVGGSALYVRAIVDSFDFPGTDPEVRAELQGELDHRGAPALHERLARLDPEAAAAIEPGNGRRVVRALEVIALTGRPFRAGLPPRHYLLPDVVQVGLRLDRVALDQRIAERVEGMWAAGFVQEVRRLARQGLRDGLTASRALGYRQVLQFLDGEITEAEAQQQTVTATRRFARRQESWFRADNRIQWVDATEQRRVEEAYAISSAG
ncbi:MAG TPA: tRNA (adenosine(37)-N6)-dimethylallyltransferase MiaA [Propionibacteriaceae bacterium]|nr:tRNA (adenosine(37)-N6)-dimethylallyltransferase MiaA [Propionibacteriaceae bacterium]